MIANAGLMFKPYSGFGTSMNDNTPVVVMWPNGNGTATLSQRLATGHVEPHIDSNPAREATISKHRDIVGVYFYS